MTTLLIVSDVRLYRDGLTAVLITHAERMRIVGIAAHGAEAMRSIEAVEPQVALIDLGMPDALTIIGAIRQRGNAIRVIALNVPETENAILDCAIAGIAGYVCRNGSIEELLTAIESAERDEFFCTPKAAATLLKRVRASTTYQDDTPADFRLTRRELVVMQLVDEGLSNKQIAARLNVQTSTVKNHVHNALQKLCSHHRSEAGAKLRRAGLLTLVNARSSVAAGARS
jgi:two-component system, NarL family, nitrate/nitrite response regulator NarL